MSEETLETPDALVPEGDSGTIPETESKETPEDTEKIKEYGENQKIRAEKAEKELKSFKAQAAKAEKETPKNEPTSNEPDYAKLAFLESRKVEHPDDQKIVMDEAARLKLPLTDILGMEHIKSKLKDSNDQREAQSGMPKGKGKAGGSSQGDVDYWIAKGEAPNDPELREKYFDKRLKAETTGNMFSDELYNE